MGKKPLSGSTVKSQVSLLFSNIIGLKYENRLSCDLFLQKLTSFIGVISF